MTLNLLYILERIRKKKRGSRMYSEVDGETGDVIRESVVFSGKKLNYTMLHKPNLEIYKGISGGAAKLLLILLDRYVEMNTNRLTCRKVDLERLMGVSRPTLLGYWKELVDKDVLHKVGGWYYMNHEVASYGHSITKDIKLKNKDL